MPATRVIHQVIIASKSWCRWIRNALSRLVLDLFVWWELEVMVPKLNADELGAAKILVSCLVCFHRSPHTEMNRLSPHPHRKYDWRIAYSMHFYSFATQDVSNGRKSIFLLEYIKIFLNLIYRIFRGSFNLYENIQLYKGISHTNDKSRSIHKLAR